MDFSGAQRGAHAQEYAEIMISVAFPSNSFEVLSAESQLIERNRYIKEAQEAEVGCDVHFWRSSTRLKKNGALIPPESINTFDNLIRQLLSAATSDVQFTEAVVQLKASFPRIANWLDWWLRPTIASMIFPSRSVIDSMVA